MIPKWLQVVENWFIDLFMRVKLDNMEPDTINAPVSETEVTQTLPTKVPFAKFCACIAQYEGANPANNNPYDFRYYFGGYLPKYGVVKESSGGFAMFSSLELGEEYGQTCITEMITNHPEWDFYDFFSVFAPSSDNNDPVAYAKWVASQCGCQPIEVLSQIIQF